MGVNVLVGEAVGAGVEVAGRGVRVAEGVVEETTITVSMGVGVEWVSWHPVNRSIAKSRPYIMGCGKFMINLLEEWVEDGRFSVLHP